MAWGPEDWELWTPEEAPRPAGVPEPVRLIQRTLLRIPGRRRKTAGDIGCGLGTMLPFLSAHFARVVAVEPRTTTLAEAREASDGLSIEFRQRRLDDLNSLRGRLHVAVAVDSIGGHAQGIDIVLAQIHDCLVEGGVVLATLPGVRRGGPPYAMSLVDTGERATGELHEVELQYRLRQAGFQGLRIRRFAGDDDEAHDTLLFMAARRANN